MNCSFTKHDEAEYTLTNVMENGMRFFINSHTQEKNTSIFALAVKAGSVLEKDTEIGTAHFVEHMCLSKQESDIINESSYITCRAYTNYEETVYTVKTSCNSKAAIEKCLTILEYIACDATADFNLDRIEKVRKDILEEWDLTQNNQKVPFRNCILQALFNGSIYAHHLPIGSKKQIKELDREVLIKYYQDWYRTDLMAVIAVGDFDLHLVQELMHKHFNHLSCRTGPERIVYEIQDYVQPKLVINHNSQAEDTEVNLYIRQSYRPSLAPMVKLADQVCFSMLMKRLELHRQKHAEAWNDIFWTRERFLIKYEFLVLSVKLHNNDLCTELFDFMSVLITGLKLPYTEAECLKEQKVLKTQLKLSRRFYPKAPVCALLEECLYNFIYNEPIMSLDEEYQAVSSFLASTSKQDFHNHMQKRLNTVNKALIISSPILRESDAASVSEGCPGTF